MTYAVIRLPRARADAMAIADYIADDNVSAAVEFLRAVEETVHGLAEFPRQGRVRFRPRTGPPIHSIAIKGFRNYLAFYRVLPDAVEILRVMHGARRVRIKDLLN